jgi:GNAT superfamily N-acetyltransferase
MVIARGVSAAKNNTPVKMTRANLDNVPEFALPSGFALRWYQPGDEQHWLRIHLAADRLDEITPELFQTQFGLAAERGLQSASTCERRSGMKSALHELGKRQCYLLAPTGEVIGTGTAWFNDNFEDAPLPERNPSRVAAGRETGGRTILRGPLSVEGAAGGDRPRSARWGRVHWMAITPQFQGRGLGKTLLSAICQRLRELGHERAYLTTSSARVQAVGLYLKFGFEPLIRNIEDESLWREMVRLAKHSPREQTS